MSDLHNDSVHIMLPPSRILREASEQPPQTPSAGAVPTPLYKPSLPRILPISESAVSPSSEIQKTFPVLSEEKFSISPQANPLSALDAHVSSSEEAKMDSPLGGAAVVYLSLAASLIALAFQIWMLLSAR